MTGRRTLVAASLPSRCSLCRGTRRMALVSLLGMRATGTVRCPHCNPESGQNPVPIYHYDRPRGASA